MDEDEGERADTDEDEHAGANTDEHEDACEDGRGQGADEDEDEDGGREQARRNSFSGYRSVALACPGGEFPVGGLLRNWVVESNLANLACPPFLLTEFLRIF